MTDELFVHCSCGSIEHQLVLTRDTEQDEPEVLYRFVYLHVHLLAKGFWRRLWVGLRYAMGYHSRYGHWDEVILGPEQATQMWRLLEAYLKEQESE